LDHSLLQLCVHLYRLCDPQPSEYQPELQGVHSPAIMFTKLVYQKQIY
jgi:hypothetical protein